MNENNEAERHEMKHYMMIALTVFVTFCCCILFFFMIYRFDELAALWRQIANILQPITIGLVLAYLLNPVMKFQEKYLYRFFDKKLKDSHRAWKAARSVAICGALLFLVGIFVLLIALILPSVSTSIQGVITKLPEEINTLVAWIEDFTKGDDEIAEVARQAIEKASKVMQRFWEEDVLTEAQAYLASITSGVIYGVKLVINVLVGLIISVYVMASQETFAGQGKKIIYALFKPARANVIIETVRKSNEIFGGFIIGKLLDSAIIGVLAYIILAIMRMPDTILIAVIIGVTNVIPFFGPFVGAVPSFIIIVLQNPLQGIYFLIFVLILQQVDGNIIGPKILGSSTGLSSFWVVFAILVFGGLWGFPGMLLGVPIMAVIYYIAEKLIEYFLGRRGLKPDTKSYIRLVGVESGTNRMIYEAVPAKEQEEPVKKSRKVQRKKR